MERELTYSKAVREAMSQKMRGDRSGYLRLSAIIIYYCLRARKIGKRKQQWKGYWQIYSSEVMLNQPAFGLRN